MKTTRYLSLFGLALAVFFYVQGELFLAITMALAVVYFRLQWYVRQVERWAGGHFDSPANHCRIDCSFSVEEVLTDPSVDRLFHHLRAKGAVDFPTANEWRTHLLSRFRELHARDSNWESVFFLIRDRMVMVNDHANIFGNSIRHEIAIPYVAGLDSSNKPFTTPAIEVELRVRLLMVNGCMVLQLGSFDERTTPRLFRGGSLPVYQTYVTLTRFPIMHFAESVDLPEEFLGLSYHATKGYQDYWLSGQRPAARPWWRLWEKRDHGWAEWRRIQDDVIAYRMACDFDAGRAPVAPDQGAIERLIRRRSEYLEAGGFKDISSRPEPGWPELGMQFQSRFLHISFHNFNANRRYSSEHWLTDYYETRP